MEKVAILALGGDFETAKDFADGMDGRMPTLIPEVLSDLDEYVELQCAVYGMSMDEFRSALTRGYPTLPEMFLEAGRKVLVAADQKSHQFLEELKMVIRTEVQPGKNTESLQVLRLSDALSRHLKRRNYGNVWIQEDCAMSAETQLRQHIREQTDLYTYYLNTEAERQLTHLAHESVMQIRLQRTPAGADEVVQKYQYAVHCLAKGVNTIVFEDWAEPLFERWDQSRVPMTVLNATTIYMQEALLTAFKIAPPQRLIRASLTQ